MAQMSTSYQIKSMLLTALQRRTSSESLILFSSCNDKVWNSFALLLNFLSVAKHRCKDWYNSTRIVWIKKLQAKPFDLTNFALFSKWFWIKLRSFLRKSWHVRAFTEKLIPGQWSLYALKRKISDFCAVMHSPTEIRYKYTKDLKACPLERGVNLCVVAHKSKGTTKQLSLGWK